MYSSGTGLRNLSALESRAICTCLYRQVFGTIHIVQNRGFLTIIAKCISVRLPCSACSQLAGYSCDFRPTLGMQFITVQEYNLSRFRNAIKGEAFVLGMQ